MTGFEPVPGCVGLLMGLGFIVNGVLMGLSCEMAFEMVCWV